ncbi:MAG: hypothetical protein WCF65_04600 [Parachlamydiaceae bacterium]
MMKIFYFLAVFFLHIGFCSATFTISSKDIQLIGEKIWENECGKKIEGLTHWNNGEDFGSFGIGHFIWYPEGRQDRFQETFPGLLTFLECQGIALPLWLKESKGCPWRSRDDFYENTQSPQMTTLRQILFETRHLQAMFITIRLEKSFPETIKNLPDGKKQHLGLVFSKLASDPQGLYALIDYTNFKGMGSSLKESYNNQGWGLLQVLERIPASSDHVVSDFIVAAKQLLTLRVHNAPPARHEEKWLKGWLNRIDTYGTGK